MGERKKMRTWEDRRRKGSKEEEIRNRKERGKEGKKKGWREKNMS